MTSTKLKLSPRSRARLTGDEIIQLKRYIEDEPTAYATITRNTRIHRRTIIDAIKNGYMQLSPYLRLRDFLAELKKLTA